MSWFKRKDKGIVNGIIKTNEEKLKEYNIKLAKERCPNCGESPRGGRFHNGMCFGTIYNGYCYKTCTHCNCDYRHEI